MKQLLQDLRTGEILLAEVPLPACGRGRVLVRTHRSVVSTGTERHALEFSGKSLIGKALARPDLVRQVLDVVRREGFGSAVSKASAKLNRTVCLGYSAAGEVVEVGEETEGLVPGDRVAVAGAGWAAHAEFNSVPRNLCARLPPGVSYADGAFSTIGAIALQGVRRAEPLIGEHVVVMGLGLVGLLTVQILKAGGCSVLGVDPDGHRASMAQKVGADAVASGGDDADRACDALTHGRGADAVIVAAATPSNDPITRAAGICRPKGRVVVVGLVGMDVPRDVFYRKELDLRLSMSYGPGRYDPAYEDRNLDYPLAHVRFTAQRNMESFLYLVQQGRVVPDALVTHRMAFQDALDAYALLQGRLPSESPACRPYAGIVLEYPSSPNTDRTVQSRLPGKVLPAPAARELRVGVVGAGSFARGVLLPQIVRLRGARLVGICTASGPSSRDAARRFRCAVATTDPERLFNDDAVDAVVIATRHSSHAKLAAKALSAGKHVFVEKPLCLSEGELNEVECALNDAREAGRDPRLMVGFNRRFSPHARALVEAFAGRSSPMVVNYRVFAGRLPTASWLADPAEGGRIIGEACHFVDFCGALIGCAPVDVTARSAGSVTPSATSQSVVLTIRYADGSLATIQYIAVGNVRLRKERCEVFADERTAILDDFRTTRFRGGGRNVRGKQAKGFAEELRAFYDACVNGAWPISWESMASTHQVCFGAEQSLQIDRPVPLDRSPLV